MLDHPELEVCVNHTADHCAGYHAGYNAPVGEIIIHGPLLMK